MKIKEKKLARLVHQNPDLPILPLIRGEEGTRLVGRVGESRIDEFVTLYVDGEAHVFTRADEGELAEYFAINLTPRDRKPSAKETDERVVKAYEAAERLPWRSAIIVNID